MVTPTDDLRARGYRLLSRAFLRGIDDELYELLDVAPGARPGPDERAAEHHRLLRREVLPYASVFLEPDRTLGGRTTRDAEARLGRLRAARGAPPDAPPDHVGVLFHVLGELTERGDSPALRAVLDGHALWWVPSFAFALRRNADPGGGWHAVAGLALETVLDHRAALSGAAGAITPPPDPPTALGEAPPPLDVDAGPGAIAEHLVTPVRAGLLLSLGDLRGLARRESVPGGFGDRVRVAETLVSSAARLEAIVPLLASVRRLLEDEATSIRELESAGLPARFGEPWRRRLEVTAAGLSELEASAPPA